VSEAITSWRIASQGLTWKANDLSGNGSARHPGRWNSLDRPLVYSSSSIALACLETMVRITIPSQHWRQRKIVGQEEFSGWGLPPTPQNAEDWLATTRAWGDAWLLGRDSLLAEVPSVIVPEESNLLLNPRHPAHGELVAEIVRPWVYDARLLPSVRAGTPQAGPPWQQPLGGAVALEMVPIPAGEFLMGSPEDEEERANNEGPQHRVRLAPFSMARTPITQAQWRQVARWQPAPGELPWERELNPDPSFCQSGRSEDDRRPVERVSWFDAQEFCHRLSRRTGRTYTLPSEAQWEYACRAGTTTAYAFGASLSQRQANIAGSGTTAVGSYPANAWGLHDMHGNVWEWCTDLWHPNYRDAPDDGRPWMDPIPDPLMRRLLRGGSWLNNPRNCRSAYRAHFQPVNANFYVGFRVVCLPQGPSLNS
jgi:formylglycine-generating enzyme required for sulfatase activity/RES domain-containing protein